MKIHLKFSNSNKYLVFDFVRKIRFEYLGGSFFRKFACDFVGKITFEYLGDFFF